ncbi:hypothetical protein LJR030_001513 [Rhizobium sp. LjRoot30]|uniref:hypothetical protein n=1 Tax=Rhizobium sp. LjRoot30 TaxID=3342320 RepID=UPI003ECC761A
MPKSKSQIETLIGEGGDRKSVRHDGELIEDKADRFTKTAAGFLGDDFAGLLARPMCKILHIALFAGSSIASAPVAHLYPQRLCNGGGGKS